MAIDEKEVRELIETVKAQDKTIKDLTKRLDEGVPEGGTRRILRAITERRVEVRMVDGKVVVGYKNRGSDNRPIYIYDKQNPADPTNPHNRLLYVDLILEGMKPDDTPISVNYKEFRQESTRVQCKVAATEEKEWVINQGVVRKKEVDEYSTVELDFDVPLDVVGKARFFTVEIPAEHGGPRKLVVHENYVNI